MDDVNFSDSLSCIWKLVNFANNYIEKEAPWKLSKEGKTGELEALMYNLMEVLRIVAILVNPYIPSTGKGIWDQLGLQIPLQKQTPADLKFGNKIARTVNKGQPLFPRIEKI
jgi:methionyl-tRNA synthetase